MNRSWTFRSTPPALVATLSVALALSMALVLPTARAATAAARQPAAPTAPHAPKRYTIEQFMATTSLTGASFSPDERRILYSSNESGIWNAYAVSVTGGKPVALTRSTTDSVYAVAYFPDDERVLTTRDHGGDEQNHLYVRELDGTERDLTPGASLKAEFQGWSGDDRAFYVTTNERDAKYFDVYRVDARTYERSLVFQNDQGLSLAAISRDGRWLAFDKTNTTSDGDVLLYDSSTRELKPITPHTGTVNFRAQAFDPASQHLLYLSDDGGEFARVMSYTLADGTAAESERADWDIVSTDYSRDGRYRITVINQDASLAVRITDTTTGRPVTLPPLPPGQLRNVGFSRRSQRLAFYVNGDRSPNNLYVYDLGTKALKQLTQSLSKEIAPADLVEARVVRFKSFDGMVVPSIYYAPHEASPTHKVPAIVYVHGGPGGQTTRGYSALIQYLVNHGYAVLGINNRGSSGYGKSFYTADDKRHGREPLWDCVEAKTWLASQGNIDPERIAILGGSYGGYMTLAALAFRPEAFKVGVDIFGVSNWVRTLESIPPYWESARLALYAEIGDPKADHDMLVAASPLFHAKEIRRPLMVVQGANDPRVIKPESDEIVEAVKHNGVPVDYLVFDDEGHGFTKKKNQIEANRRIGEFLDRYLKAPDLSSRSETSPR